MKLVVILGWLNHIEAFGKGGGKRGRWGGKGREGEGGGERGREGEKGEEEERGEEGGGERREERGRGGEKGGMEVLGEGGFEGVMRVSIKLFLVVWGFLGVILDIARFRKYGIFGGSGGYFRFFVIFFWVLMRSLAGKIETFLK